MLKEVLVDCLKRAGKIQTDNFLKVNEVSLKEKISSIVTEVDFKCDKAIIEIIKENLPEHNILSEESGFINNNSNYTWIIDPLDGTSNYVAGLPWFGVLIAVLNQNLPVLAGAYIPIAEKLFIAEAQKGTYLNGQKLTLKDQKLEDSLVAFSTDYTENDDYLKKGLDIYKFMISNSRNVRTTNCLVDLLNIAENKFACCINMFSGIWDIAAPYLIIKEAGGCLKDIYNHDLIFEPNEENSNKNYPIIAGSEIIVDKILNNIKLESAKKTDE